MAMVHQRMMEKVKDFPHSERCCRQRISWLEATPVVRSAAMSSAPPGYVIPRSWFTTRIVDFDLWLICGGRIEWSDARGETRMLSRGAMILLKPGDDFELRVVGSEPYTNAFVHFDLLNARGRTLPHRQVALPPTVGHVQDTHYFEAVMRRIMFLQYRLHNPESASHDAQIRKLSGHLLKGLLYDYHFSQRADGNIPQAGLEMHHRQKADAALSWIYLHPGTRISAAELAEKFGYSQRHFRRIFREAHGKTPGQALVEARIDHAKKLLSGSALNVTEVAASLNYENVFYFSRQFGRIVGMSPLKYRRQM